MDQKRRDIRALGVPLGHTRSETEETPPSDRIRDIVRNEQQKRVECRIECRKEIEALGMRTVESERKASSATRLAAEADARTAGIDSNFRTIKGMILGLSGIVLAVVGWLVVEVRSADKRARETAEVVAEKTILAADRRFDERIKTNTTDTIKAMLDEQAKRGKDPDVVTARQK